MTLIYLLQEYFLLISIRHKMNTDLYNKDKSLHVNIYFTNGICQFINYIHHLTRVNAVFQK